MRHLLTGQDLSRIGSQSSQTVRHPRAVCRMMDTKGIWMCDVKLACVLLQRPCTWQTLRGAQREWPVGETLTTLGDTYEKAARFYVD